MLWIQQRLTSAACQQLTTLQACRQFFKGLYAKLQANIFSQDPATFSEDVFSFDNMVWAIQIVRAHVHGPLEGKDVALVPIADLVRSFTLTKKGCIPHVEHWCSGLPDAGPLNVCAQEIPVISRRFSCCCSTSSTAPKQLQLSCPL